MCIGLKIKELASKKNITLAELAKRLGKSKQAIYEIVEKDDVNTSILRKLCEIFDVPMGYFFDEETGSVTTSGDFSPASLHGDATVGADAVLAERVKSLEQLLVEKERIIKLYEKMMEEK